MFPRKAVRRAAGHSRLFWFFPIFSLVLLLVVGALSTDQEPDRFLIRFWTVVAVGFFLVSVLVFSSNTLDQRYLRDLDERVREAPLSTHPVLRRYQIEVGLFLMTATFHTPFRPETAPPGRFDLWLACLVTVLLGWWSLFGWLRVPLALIKNARGGEKVHADDLLKALRDSAG